MFFTAFSVISPIFLSYTYFMSRLKRFLFNTIILSFTSLFMGLIGIFFDIYIANRLGSEGARDF